MNARSLLGGIAVAALVAVAGTGCDDDLPCDCHTWDGPPGYLPQSSPVNALANLRRAYVERNIDEYRKLFANDFAFVFDSTDVADPVDPTPVSWPLADEVTSTTNMFRDDRVERIELQLDPGPVERADSALYGPRTWKMTVAGPSLRVDTRNEEGAALMFQIPPSTEVFYFREDPERLASDGRPSFFVFRWEDLPNLEFGASDAPAPAQPVAAHAATPQPATPRPAPAQPRDGVDPVPVTKSWGWVKARYR